MNKSSKICGEPEDPGYSACARSISASIDFICEGAMNLLDSTYASMVLLKDPEQAAEVLSTTDCSTFQESIEAEDEEQGAADVDSVPEKIFRRSRSEFYDLDIKPSSVRFEPDLQGFGYKGRHTNMFVDPREPHVQRDFLGHEVELRATPVEYHWAYGDGMTRTTFEPGEPLPERDGSGQAINKMNFKTVTSHVYESTGVYPVSVTVNYTGEYRVDGGEWVSMDVVLPVESSPGEADIWTQNSRWVSGACESRDQWGCNGPIQFDPSTDRPPKIYQDQYDENGNWLGPVN